jgi:hypothetical protein
VPAEQEGARPREPAGYCRPEVLVVERERPAAVGEAAAGVLFRPAGRLHDAVEGQEGVQGESHGGLRVSGE